LTERPSGDERVGDGRAPGDERLMAGIAAVAHLQNAALELIAALRATLDMAEDLVRDPAVLTAGDTVAGVVARVFEAVEPIIAGRPRPDPDRPDGDEGVQHIRVS
jgi:hypothetical protein